MVESQDSAQDREVGLDRVVAYDAHPDREAAALWVLYATLRDLERQDAARKLMARIYPRA